MQGFGSIKCAGIEGTSSYRAGLARHLREAGAVVVEAERPSAGHLRRNGKSYPRDAESAAWAVLAGETAGEPKRAGGCVEMFRAFHAAEPVAPNDLVQSSRSLWPPSVARTQRRLTPSRAAVSFRTAATYSSLCVSTTTTTVYSVRTQRFRSMELRPP